MKLYFQNMGFVFGNTGHSDQFGLRPLTPWHYHGARQLPRLLTSPWQLGPQISAQIPAVEELQTQTWSSVAAQAQMSHGLRWLCRLLSSACSSPPPCLRFHLSPQCTNPRFHWLSHLPSDYSIFPISPPHIFSVVVPKASTGCLPSSCPRPQWAT